ncbi:hypothetical protein NUH88_07000 [Nisaea acidiphila]|uniref:Tetratricopeptide repeat protein n=1 Tax=Nisaea acidiphila TaxID=1862145 RepID=A0A9J7AYU3_9PROT|nr:tetratricopeptide repeat protein [Nisaea acidiphila]UUX51436.1 hypothetical protein NUH88_07000 [Nisaea acidiphila]
MSATVLSLDQAFALHRRGDHAAAAAAYRVLLGPEPENAALWEYLGIASAELKHRDRDTLLALGRSLILAPSGASALFNYAAYFVRTSSDPLALKWFRRTTAAAPGKAEHWMQRANTAIRLGRNSEAMAAHSRATRLDPHDPHKWEQRATLLRRAARREAADRVTREGLALNPGAANLWAARSAVFFELDVIDEAREAGMRSIAADPTNPDGLANHAQALYRAGDVPGAIQRATDALRRAPDNPVVAFNLGLYMLTAGHMTQGWRLYDARLVPTVALRRGLPATIWKPGGPGRNLIVPAEQGLGDEVLFSSCFPELEKRLEDGALASVTVEATDRLLPLMRRSFPDFHFFERIRKPENRLDPANYSTIVRETGADCSVMAGSLPGLFRPSLDAMPETAGYLVPDPEQVARWRTRLAEIGPGPYLGLSWRSRAGRDLGAIYYPGAGNLSDLLSIPGLSFVTLQYDEDEAELQAIERENDVEITRPEGLDLTNDLDGVSALIAALDAVVSPQNLVLSLTGALGVRGYTMPHTVNWVSLGTDSMPFYPSIRLDRRRDEEGADWGPVMARLAGWLKRDLAL